MGCGAGCGCGDTKMTLEQEVNYMKGTIDLMRESNMFSPLEVQLLEEAVNFYADKEFHQHQTPIVPDKMEGWGKGYEVIN